MLNVDNKHPPPRSARKTVSKNCAFIVSFLWAHKPDVLKNSDPNDITMYSVKFFLYLDVN